MGNAIGLASTAGAIVVLWLNLQFLHGILSAGPPAAAELHPDEVDTEEEDVTSTPDEEAKYDW